MTHINTMSRKELMALPVRPWDKESLYDSVAIITTRRKHDSGWACMAIIGCNKQVPVEIASMCSDDIEWKLPDAQRFGARKQYSIGQMRMDCSLKSGAVHAWSSHHRFKVGAALSSIEIELVAK